MMYYLSINKGYDMKAIILDAIAAITIIAGLTVLALAYFDVLIK